MRPKLPLAQMGGARWNLIEGGGCRIACFENETNCYEVLKLYNEGTRILRANLQAPFEVIVLCSLLEGDLSERQADHWASDSELPRFAATVKAIRKHIELEGGENPFSLFKRDDEEFDQKDDLIEKLLVRDAELTERLGSAETKLHQFKDALEKAALLLEHSDFTNGVTDSTGTIDEGRTKAGWMLDEIRQVLKELQS